MVGLGNDEDDPQAKRPSFRPTAIDLSTPQEDERGPCAGYLVVALAAQSLHVLYGGVSRGGIFGILRGKKNCLEQRSLRLARC
jgi:hypothetical protein